jgi:hypothetical protein
MTNSTIISTLLSDDCRDLMKKEDVVENIQDSSETHENNSDDDMKD